MGAFIKNSDGVKSVLPNHTIYYKFGLSDSTETILLESNSRGSINVVMPGTGASDWPKKNLAPDVVIAVPYTSSKLSAEISVGDIGIGGFTAYLKNTGGTAAYFKVMWLAIWR
jgi:hypothetical protein|nr:MAG TPA: hypothetical protein [Bacteriophage sp.]